MCAAPTRPDFPWLHAIRPALACAGLSLVLLVTACGGADRSGTGQSISTDSTPTNRSSGPRPTADSPPLGGGGGPSTGDSIGSGGGITGSGGASGPTSTVP